MNKEELLYRYFSNSLNEAEEVQLKKLLDNDAEFKAKFEFEHNLKRITKEERHIALRSKLNQFETKINTNSIHKEKRFPYLKIAASILVLVTVSLLTYQSFFNINYDKLYTENYSTYPNTVYALTRSDTINSIEREAFVAYEAGNYQLAIEKFRKAEPKAYFSFYKGQSYLNLDRYDAAKKYFRAVVASDKVFVAEAKWYLGLIALKKKDINQASKYLKDLIKNHSYKTEEVKLILDAIN